MTPAPQGMLVLGVTGGIGSGKSSVSRFLAERGARVLDADRVVRELYGGGALVDRIRARFGDAVVAANGSVDRAGLASIVFQDPAARRDLEALVHPEVRNTIIGRLRDWRAAGFTGIAVVDAALLVEAAGAYPLDALVIVTAAAPLRLDRLEARGVPRAEAERRMAAQLDDSTKIAAGDHVIRNDGSLADLQGAVDRLLSDLGRDDAPTSG